MIFAMNINIIAIILFDWIIGKFIFLKLLTKFLPLLSLFPPETAHSISLNSLKVLSYFNFKETNILDSKKLEIMNLSFSNRLGLAAGMDKNADYVDSLASLGFGFLEIAFYKVLMKIYGLP